MDSVVVDGLFLGERKERIFGCCCCVYLGGCGLEAIQGERGSLYSLQLLFCSTIAQLYRRYRMNTMELSVGESVLHLEQRRRYHGFIRTPTS